MNDKTAPELKVSESLQSLAKKIEKSIKIGEGGVVTVEKDFFEATLPEDLSISQYRKAQDHESDVIAAAGLALGHAAIPYFKKHKNADGVTMSFGIGKNQADLRIDREKTYPGMNGSEPRTSHVVLSAKYTAHGAVSSRGTFRKVRSYLAEMGAYSKAD